MSDPLDVETTVRLIADGLLRGDPEAATLDRLVSAGIPRAQAPEYYRKIKTACQQGVQSVITDGLSVPNVPSKDPLLAAAFRVGQESVRGAVRGVWLKRALWLAAIALAVITLVWLAGYSFP